MRIGLEEKKKEKKKRKRKALSYWRDGKTNTLSRAYQVVGTSHDGLRLFDLEWQIMGKLTSDRLDKASTAITSKETE